MKAPRKGQNASPDFLRFLYSVDGECNIDLGVRFVMGQIHGREAIWKSNERSWIGKTPRAAKVHSIVGAERSRIDLLNANLNSTRWFSTVQRASGALPNWQNCQKPSFANTQTNVSAGNFCLHHSLRSNTSLNLVNLRSGLRSTTTNPETTEEMVDI